MRAVGLLLDRGGHRRVPSPDPNWAVDVLDADLAAVLEVNVDAVADAFVDDRRDANASGLGERLEPRGDVDAVAVNVLALDDDVAEIDADAQHDRRRCAVRLGRQGSRALYGERTVHGIDHAAELDNGAVADQFYDPPVMGGDGGVEDDLAVPFQGAERAGLIGAHEAGIADHVGSENRRELTVDAFLGHVFPTIPPRINERSPTT